MLTKQLQKVKDSSFYLPGDIRPFWYHRELDKAAYDHPLTAALDELPKEFVVEGCGRDHPHDLTTKIYAGFRVTVDSRTVLVCRTKEIKAWVQKGPPAPSKFKMKPEKGCYEVQKVRQSEANQVVAWLLSLRDPS